MYRYHLHVNETQKPSRSTSLTPGAEARDPDSPIPESSFNISNEETIRRLRTKGQPIRLFAESDRDRRLRLRALELIEEKGNDRQSGQNDFKKALEDVENVERELRNKSKGKKKDDAEEPSTGVLDLELIKTDPDRLYPLIYYALKRTLKEWERAMDERPGQNNATYWTPPCLCPLAEYVKRTTQGKLAAVTQVQSAQNLKPLFKTLRSRVRQMPANGSPIDTQRMIVITFGYAGSHSGDCPLYAEAPVPESQ